MARGLGENPSHEIEPIGSAGERQLRLVPILGRKLLHRVRVDVGRIGQDQVVARIAERREQIAFEQRDPLLEIVLGDVDLCDLERLRREVDGVDPGVGKGPASQNREAP